jgi:hypothetical protein
MFEAVKRVTSTTADDWTITHESAEKRWQESHVAVMNGDFGQFTRMLYSRMFFPNGGGTYKPLDNEALSLAVEDLDEFTAVGVCMGENSKVAHSH